MLVDALGELVPIAVGVAISVGALIAQLVILTTPRWRRNGLAFLAGGVGALGALVVVVSLLTSGATTDDDGPSTLVAWVTLALGALLLWLAIGQWRGRGNGDGEPKWLSGIADLSAGRAALLGAALMVVNGKNIPLAVGAAGAIGDLGLSAGQAAVAFAVFLALSGAGIGLPLVVRLTAGDAVGAPLARAREWLVRHGATITATVLLLVGANLVGKGLRGLA